MAGRSTTKLQPATAMSAGFFVAQILHTTDLQGARPKQ
jgi:hypothetical protein